MKNVIITGTKGFIGGRLLNRLKGEFNCYEINEDIFDSSDLTKEIDNIMFNVNPVAVFHVGACSNTLETDVNYMMSRNFEFTKILSDQCTLYKHNIPFVYSSSAANYGIDGTSPSNLYGWSKYVAEQYVTLNGGVALRYFNVYGPGEEHKGKMSSVAFQMWKKYKRGDIIKIFPGKPQRDFVYIEDVIEANIEAYKNYDEYHFHWFDVGYGESRTFEDVLDIMAIPFEYTDENDIPKGYQFFTKSNPDKWMSGWKPKYPIEVGLTEYKKYLENGKF
jgi:ADP-L-glycero-D-manno-heptose 6-epimerase